MDFGVGYDYPNFTPVSGGMDIGAFTPYTPGSAEWANWSPSAQDLAGYNLGGYGAGFKDPEQEGTGVSGVQSDVPYMSYQSQTPGVMQPPAAVPTQPPSTGLGTGSSGAQQAKVDQDDWRKLLIKGGIGVGTGLLGKAGEALFSGGGGKKQGGGSQLPPPPSNAAPMAAPMEPLPGTKASPLISGQPMMAKGTSGLYAQNRMRQGGNTGGFQLY